MTRKARKEAWDHVMEIARPNVLIAQGAVGVVILVHPDTQDEEGLTEKCLQMAMAVEEAAGLAEGHLPTVW